LHGEGQVAYQFELATGLDCLETLQVHPNHAIYKATEALVTKFFKEDQEQQVVASSSAATGQ